MEKMNTEITREFLSYKREMLMKDKLELWNRSHMIDFFCSVYEYFLNNENIPDEIKKGIEGKVNVIESCWEIYLKTEQFSVQSWENIECILRKYVEDYKEMEEKRMSFDEFEKVIQKKVKRLLHGNEEVIISDTLKNNSIYVSGLMIKGKESNMSPTIYLEEFYHAFLEGASTDCLAKKIVAMYQKHKMAKPIDVSFFKEWEKVKSKIVYKIISKEKNEELLKIVPFVEYFDLAIVFYVRVKDEKGQKGSILIYNSHCDAWNISKNELVKAAMRNTPLLLPAVYKPIKEIIAELLECESDELPEGNIPIFVLTNEEQLYGAATLLYPGVLDEIANQQKSNLYVILSSVHEVLIIPEKYYINMNELRDMVKEINATQVLADEVMEDTVYYYQRSTSKLIIPM